MSKAPIRSIAVVKLIFWGSSWISAPGDKIFGMVLIYKSLTGSGYANIQTECSGKNGQGYVLQTAQSCLLKGGIPVRFAFIFNLDGDSGCTSGSPPANPGWQMCSC